MLRWYAEHFDTVEINNSFYRLPAETAFETWCRETSPDFCFAVKASRYITHNRKLNDPESANEKFISLVERLGSRLGPILFQLPPSWKVNAERLDQFLSALPRTHRYVVEFRNPTWNARRYTKSCAATMRLSAFTNLAAFNRRSKLRRTSPTFGYTAQGANIRGITAMTSCESGPRGSKIGCGNSNTSSFILTTIRPVLPRRMLYS